MHILVFSKDRPLQLEGYLASLLHCSGLPQEAVTALFVEDPSYAPLRARYPGVRWLAEVGGFHASLEQWVSALPDDAPILFGCDDVVWFNPFDPAKVASHLAAHPRCAGFTLKLGSNIRGASHLIPAGAPTGSVVEWDANGRAPEGLAVSRDFYGYPFEVMGTAYRAGLCKRMFSVAAQNGWRFRGPNDFEPICMRMLRARRVGLLRRLSRRLRGKPAVPGDGVRLLDEVRLAMFNAPSCCAAQDVNRVQDIAQNIVKGGIMEDAAELKRKFTEGWRMEWRHMAGILPPEAFIGMDYWRLVPPGEAP